MGSLGGERGSGTGREHTEGVKAGSLTIPGGGGTGASWHPDEENSRHTRTPSAPHRKNGRWRGGGDGAPLGGVCRGVSAPPGEAAETESERWLPGAGGWGEVGSEANTKEFLWGTMTVS